MLILALDTAGPNRAAALARADGEGIQVVARKEERIGRGHDERLMPAIDAALAEAGADFSDIGRIAVTTGPGSFTGVRIGVAAARALALALKVPAIGIGSLEAILAPLASRQEGTVVAALDARRGEIYVLARDAGSQAIVIEAGAMRAEDAAKRLRGAPSPVALTGAGAPLIAAALGGTDAEVTEPVEFPDIAVVARLGLQAKVGASPVPIYGRGADAKPQIGRAVARA